MQRKRTIILLWMAGTLALLVSHCCPKPPVETALSVETTPPAPGQAVEQGPIETPVHEHLLANGMKVLILEDHSAPVVTVQVWYRVGSRNERVGIRGLAHLTEHMMFKGSPDVGPEDHARIVDSVGGKENAFTTDDVTAYHDTVPSDRLELALELEAERMHRAKMDESHFFKEREVVKEEIRKAMQNDPIGALLQKFRNVAFTKHPYNWTPGGTLEDLDKMTPEDLRTFYKTHYSPSNAVLVVVGDADAQVAFEMAKKHFGPIAAGGTSPEVTAKEPPQTEYQNHKLVHPTQLPFVIGGYKVPEAANKDMKILEVVQVILAGGRSARMHKALVRDKKLAVFAGGFSWKMKDPGLFLIYGAHMPTITADKVETALIEEVDRLGKDGPTEEELEKARNQLLAEQTFKLTNLWQVGIGLGEAELVEGDYRNFFGVEKAYANVTAADVKRVVSTYLNKNRLTSVFLSPPPPGQAVTKDQATKIEEAELTTTDWETAERFLNLGNSSSAPITLPPLLRKTLPNGMKLIVIERREQGIVHMNMITTGGRMSEPKGKAGSAALMAEMMTHGTKTHTAEQIAEESERLGGSVSAGSGTESTSLNARFLSRDLKKGLSLFADVALHPTFPEDEMEKARQPFLGQVKMVKDSPQALGGEYMDYVLYGYDHPRGRPTSLETLSAITREDLEAMHRAAFQPKNAIMVLVGDVDGNDAMQTLEATFAAWENKGELPELPPDPKLQRGKLVQLVNKPDLTQSTIRLGHLGISRTDQDYMPLMLGNYVLGAGGFSSRLMKSVRSKGGKTYGVGSTFQTGIKKGPFAAYTFTRTRETGNTLQMVIDEIKKIRKGGITAEELQSAKNNLAGSYAITLETPRGMAQEIISAEFFGLGDNWVQDYRKAIAEPTLDEVNAALKKHLNPKNLNIVVVGNGEEVKKQVRRYGKVKESDFLDPVPEEERQ